jgi:class 3 adenylate cyclase
VAIFDGPATAIHAAAHELARAGGPDVRMGLHIAEVPLHGGPVEAPGVERAIRYADQATDRQLLTSSSVRDLVAGSSIKLKGRGRLTFNADEPEAVFCLLSD